MTRTIAVHATYQDLLARILRADSGIVDATRDAAWARWEFGCKLKAERKGRKLLPAGRLDEVAAEVGRSRSEVQSWMTCAERYPTHQQLSNALDSEPTWRQLRAGLTRKPRPAIGAGGDSDDEQDQEPVASQPEPDPGGDQPGADDDGYQQGFGIVALCPFW